MTRGKKSKKKMGLPHPKAVVWKPFSLTCSVGCMAGRAGMCGRSVVIGCQVACHFGLDCQSFFSPGRVFHQSQFGVAWAAFDGYLTWKVSSGP